MRSFDHIYKVDLSNSQVQDSDLACLRGIPSLATLALDQTAITDTGLQAFQEIRLLKGLHLAGTPITDAGLVNLKGLEFLEAVDLVALRKLKELQLDETRITDFTVGHLATLKNLRRLDYPCNATTEAGMALLREKLPFLLINLLADSLEQPA